MKPVGTPDALTVQPVEPPEEVNDVVRTLGSVAETWFADPKKSVEAQTRLSEAFISLWGSTWQRLQGEVANPVAVPEPKDNRFAHAEWSTNPVFDFIKQAT